MPGLGDQKTASLISKTKEVVLYDSSCGLCSNSLLFVIKRDTKKRFIFAALTSKAAQELIGESSSMRNMPDSIVLITKKGTFTRSDAIIQIAKNLGVPWSAAIFGYLLPRLFRNWIYDKIAKNRHRLPIKIKPCHMMTPDQQSRFIELS